MEVKDGRDDDDDGDDDGDDDHCHCYFYYWHSYSYHPSASLLSFYMMHTCASMFDFL